MTQPAIKWRVSGTAVCISWSLWERNTFGYPVASPSSNTTITTTAATTTTTITSFFLPVRSYYLRLVSECMFAWISLPVKQPLSASAGNQGTKSACFNSCFFLRDAMQLEWVTLTTKEPTQSITLFAGLLQEHNCSTIWCPVLFSSFFFFF